jgi:DNA-binding MarR family transcriptional regulator
MKKYDVLKELIDLLYAPDNIEGENGEYTMSDFLGYINSRYSGAKMKMRKISGDEYSKDLEMRRNSVGDISILIVLMYRYAKGYIKKALRKSRLQTADEFSFLITLMTYSSLSKSELTNKQVMEKTSGTEIIRRLVRNGFISEFSDEADRRSIRVSITEKGRSEILEVLPQMEIVSEIVKGNLEPAEVNTLAYLLKKLDYFHNDIYMNSRKASLEEIISDRAL